METTKPAPQNPTNLAGALAILDRPIEIEIPHITLPDGRPAAIRMHQQDNLLWAAHQRIYPMVTQPRPSIVDDPGAALERDRQWLEMGWAMCKLAVYEMDECYREANDNFNCEQSWKRRWVPVRLVEDGAAQGENDIERRRFLRCQGVVFDALVADFNTIMGVRLDSPVFRDAGDEGTTGEVGDARETLREDAARDVAGDS